MLMSWKSKNLGKCSRVKDLWSDPRFKNKWNKIILPSSTGYYGDNGENINMECILIWVIILLSVW